jgi:hypothetical protein
MGNRIYCLGRRVAEAARVSPMECPCCGSRRSAKFLDIDPQLRGNGPHRRTSSFVAAAINQRPSRRTRSRLSMPCWAGIGNPVMLAS